MTQQPINRDQRGYLFIDNLVAFIGGFIMTAIGLRLIFRFFGANADNAIVSWVYAFSEPFVRPFFGIFNTTIDTGVGRFEVESFIALLVYGLVISLLVRLFSSDVVVRR